MRALLLAVILLPLAARDIRVVHFEANETRTLRYLWAQKQYADEQWKQAVAYLERKYVKQPGSAESGEVSVPSESYLSGWEHGMEFSEDFEVAVPHGDPEEKGSCSSSDSSSTTSSSAYPAGLAGSEIDLAVRVN